MFDVPSSEECIYMMEYIHSMVQEIESENKAGSINYNHLYEVIELVREYLIIHTPSWGKEDNRIPCAICGEEVLDIYPNRHIDTMNIECQHP